MSAFCATAPGSSVCVTSTSLTKPSPLPLAACAFLAFCLAALRDGQNSGTAKGVVLRGLCQSPLALLAGKADQLVTRLFTGDPIKTGVWALASESRSLAQPIMVSG